LAKKKKISADAELARVEQIKKLAVISMFSDDVLMERLVLKGGNALDLVHRISTRASMDVDLSMPGDFPEGRMGRHKNEARKSPRANLSRGRVRSLRY
jgi:predicted nucleotidyltransferase component of viral defense system